MNITSVFLMTFFKNYFNTHKATLCVGFGLISDGSEQSDVLAVLANHARQRGKTQAG